MMVHWLDGVAKILKSSDLDIINLAKIANVDPTDIYRYADLSQCDLRGQDLRGIDLTGAILEGALLDSSTKLDTAFDPILNSKDYISFPINARLVRYINSEAHYAGYTYAVWYVKFLFEMMYNVKLSKHFISIMDELYDIHSDNFYSISIERQVRKTIQIPKYIKRWIIDFNYKDMGDEKYSFFIFSCLVFRIRYNFNSIPLVLENLIEREEKFRSSRAYLSSF
jgi:Pentapeptide repeats (8 copies)